MKLARRVAPLVLCGLALCRVARADLITLDDGHVLEGEVLSETEDEVEIRLPNGSTTIPRTRVKKIERKPSPAQELERRRDALGPKDAAGRVALARFALEKKFPREKVVALALEAFRLEPSNAGAVELLEKLDYRFENGFWIEPEKWYPRNGFQKDKGRWLPIEELALRDAVDGVAKAKKLVRDAEDRVREVERALAAIPDDEAAAKKKVEDAKAQLQTLAAKSSAAKANLDARDTDLRIASDKVVAARRDLAIVQALACPAEPQAKQLHLARLAQAELVLNNAVIEEQRAKKARDAQLQVVNDLAAAEAQGPKVVRAAEEVVEAVRARAKALEEELPQRKSLVGDARTFLRQSEKVAGDAERSLEERRARDARATEERRKALAEYAKKSAQ